MAGNVYSTYALAKEMAPERVDDLEQDIFICQCNYGSKHEFVLKTRDQVGWGNYLFSQMLPFRHRFKNKANAEREANNLAVRKEKPVYVNKKINLENGYEKIMHYYLTYNEPCLT